MASPSPEGGASKPKYSLTRFTRRVFLFSICPHSCKHGFGHLENKNPPTSLREYFDFGGERGVRTPGPAIAGQRFSRPPHSTTLPSLLKPHSPRRLSRPGGTISLYKPHSPRRLSRPGGTISPGSPKSEVGRPE